MSADNWGECPRCKRDQQSAVELRDTFREDWEIGVFNGEFFVQYKGVCGTCNLRHEFKYEQAINLDAS